MSRHDLYGPIHKGLRLALSSLLVRLGQADFATPEGERTLDALEDQLTLSSSHLAHEELYLHPALEGRRPGATALLEQDHRHHDAAFAELAERIAAVRAAPRIGKTGPGRALYLAFSRFCADDFAHMAEEEQTFLPMFHELFSDDELRAIEGELIAAIPPEKVMRYLRLMLPAGTPNERFDFLDGMRRSAPPEVFRAVLEEAAKPTLPAPEWNALAMRLRLAA